jgi:rhombotail lipoprotein
MRNWVLVCTGAIVVSLSGCRALSDALCAPACNASTHSSSSLVEFLYPDGSVPHGEDAIPQLRLPLRVGLSFLPSHGDAPTLDAAERENLLERIRQRFSSRKFVSGITLIPDYYLKDRTGFAGLEGVQRLYGVDVMALVSYDQVTHEDGNRRSLGYLTIVGAYVLHGNRHDVSTLVDLAVVDPSTRALLLRAGGIDVRQGDSTLIDERRDARRAAAEGFDAATNQLIEHFDGELTRFESDVRAGRANVRIVTTNDSGPGGGGAFGWFGLLVLLPIAAVRAACGGRIAGNE